jgi:hypothetical protein
MKTLLGFLLLSCSPAFALPLVAWQEATVKMNSFPCLTESPRFQGSGLLVSFKGEVFVLTSEHVLIQDSSDKTCHTANGASFDLVVADFKSGLALLKAKDSGALLSTAIPLEKMQHNTSSMDVLALGFPAGSEALNTLANGKVLTSESPRALIAGIAKLIEASNLPVEYGMSGGIMLSQNGSDYSFAGILSHQILRREAGQPTRPDDLKPGPNSQNDLTLAIPVNSLLTWLHAQSKPQTEPVWKRNPELQVAGKDSLQYGPLLFTLKLKKAQDAWDIGGSDASGIGGDDNGNNPQDGESLQTIDVTFVDGASSTDKGTAIQDPLLNQWREWLLAGRKVSVVSLKNHQARALVKLQSLSQFLTLWLRDGYQPLGIRSKDANAKNDADVLVLRARAVAKLTQEARDKTTVMDQKAWFAVIRDTALSAETGLASSKDISALLTGESERYWREYYSSDFDNAVTLETAVQALVTQLQKMGM